MGVVGPGAAWETRYRPALEKLAERIRVAAVFDTVAARAEQVAREFDAAPVQGLLRLVNRPDVDAVLFLDAAWHGFEALRLLCTGNKPVYIAAEIGNDISSLRACHWTAVSYGLTLMPEFGWRYTPATGRLQELLATRLGPVRAVRVNAELADAVASDPVPLASMPDDRRMLMGMFDWCRYLLRSSPERIESVERGENGSSIHQLKVRYLPGKSGSPAPVADLTIQRAASKLEAHACGIEGSGTHRVRFEVECESGAAVLESPSLIRWKTTGKEETETLTADRDEVEVMLDHFCRRVVGGLIPVTDLADVYQGLDLLDAAERSQQSGKPVEVTATR